jgi:ribosomal protein S27AE
VAADTFMLFVSTLEPRKNLPTLLHALRICIDRRPDRPYRLVVAGSRGWRDEQIFTTARDLRLGDHVLFVGAIGQYDLRWLYNACRMYINPSLYEGFGLPLLEAMACGAACLAAATSSLPEIGGNAALYVPPLDVGMWADAIEALWDDEERRAELGRLGQSQAARFSWQRAARETLKIYEHAIERAAGRAVPTYASLPERLPAIADSPLAFNAGERRTCLRCGATMLASQLQRGILVAEPIQTEDQPLAARAWLCPRCGHVELVAEHLAASAEEQLASTPPSEQPVESVDSEQPDEILVDAGYIAEDTQRALGTQEIFIKAQAEEPAAPSAELEPAEIPPDEPRPPESETNAPEGIATPHRAETLVLELPRELAAPDSETDPPEEHKPEDIATPHRAETLVLELPRELAAPASEDQSTEGEQEPSDEKPEPPITQSFERPLELTLPDLDAPLPNAEHDPREETPGLANHHGGPRNGTAPDALNGAPPISAPEQAGAQPKRQRRSRSKQKRSS